MLDAGVEAGVQRRQSGPQKSVSLSLSLSEPDASACSENNWRLPPFPFFRSLATQPERAKWPVLGLPLYALGKGERDSRCSVPVLVVDVCEELVPRPLPVLVLAWPPKPRGLSTAGTRRRPRVYDRE